MSRFMRRCIAVATLAALLVGLPTALVIGVGRPWPHPFPAPETIWRQIRGGDITDAAVIKTLALLLWLAWGRLAISILLEVVAHLSGRAAPRLAVLGSTQRSAAALVAALVLLFGASRVTSVAASPAQARPLPAALLNAEMEFVRTSQEVAPAARVLHAVMVQPGDTLSGIASQEFGDPRAWPELWNANRGREFDGRTFNDPNLILPGWQLVIPEVLTNVSSPAAPATAPSSGTDQPIACVAPVAVPVDQGTAVPINSGHLSSRRNAAPVGLGGAVLLASGVVAGLTTRRRRQLRGATRTAWVEPTAPHRAQIETVLRRLDHAELIARIDIALRALASQLHDAGDGAGVVAVLAFDDGGLEVVLSAPVADAQLPWCAIRQDCWRLPASVTLDELTEAARRVNQPCPALAHLGSTLGPGGVGAAQVFVDLEVLGLLAIDAEPPHATNIARAIAAGVAVSPLSEIAHLITYGLGDVHVGRAHWHGADSLDGALDLAIALLGSTAMASSPTVSTFALRSRGTGGEAWEPAVVVAALGDDSDVTSTTDAELIGLGEMGGRGLAIVVDRPVRGARWCIEQGEQEWKLQPLGLSFVPVGLSCEELGEVQSLLVDAEVPLVHLEPPSISTVAGSSEWIEPAWAIMVRLLGPVEVCDAAGHAAVFERSKALELVVWLSQHRDRSTRSSARTALWEIDVRDATFANVVSDSRRTLNRLVPSAGGGEWIPRTLTEDLPLHAGVVTDADVLRARLDHARTQSTTDAIATLRPGLALVRDHVFSGTSYLWTDAEGMTTQLTLLVTSAACELAGQYLSLGDIEGVFWATGQGLKVLAGHEELIALRMRAHALQGDLAGVRQEWESYERALMADPWSSAAPAPKLVALRRELLTMALSPS